MTVFVNLCALVLAILATAAILYFLVYLFSLLRRKAKPTAAEWGIRSIRFAWLYLLAGFVICGAAFVMAGLQTSREAEAQIPPVTAENTPVNLFLQLDADTTIEEVAAQEGDRDWRFAEIYESSATVDEWGAVVRGYQILPAWPAGSDMAEQQTLSYSMNQGLNGVILEIYFAVWDDGSSTLAYARLTIKTDDGTATCYYYPTDFTQYGNETGFNLSLKSASQLFPRKSLLATAQEVIDTVYPVVYPNGL